MANAHPYISSSGPIIKAIQQLRKSFPNIVDAKTLKKLGLAPNNESYAINILRFLSVIDDEGKRTSEAAKTFTQHDDKKFQAEFGGMVKKAYSDIFQTHGENAWELENDDLITYFRAQDQTTAIVGKRQANTFGALSALSGHRELPQVKVNSQGGQTGKPKPRKKVPKKTIETLHKSTPGKLEGQTPGNNVGLTVRIEINLPSDGSRKTYDTIFQSIRENLLNAM